jgi:DNA repair protein RecN (Recombination protein N)
LLRSLRIENLVLIREAMLELAPGLNAITGETGAGKTILAQAVGLLLGAKGDQSFIGPEADEAYVEAELELPEGVLDEEGFEALAELRPEDEPGLVLARRVFADGRTRAYAWGRSVAREDVAAAAERLIAMSGQFEQRRLARPSYQLDVLDSFCGTEQLERRASARRAWRELRVARRRHDEVVRDRTAAEARLAELQALAEDTAALEPGGEEALRSERGRLRHLTELGEAVGLAAESLAPEDADGAVALTARAEQALAGIIEYAPELEAAAAGLRDADAQLREASLELKSILDSLESEPGRLEQVESELDAIAAAKRRFACSSYEELLARGEEAQRELDALSSGADPTAAAAQALEEAEARVAEVIEALRTARRSAAEPFAAAVLDHLQSIGLGEGEFVAELRETTAGPTGGDEVSFLIRANRGLPLAPVAETASGGELSRIALAIAAVAGGETLVFDEIDAGIGGETAHAVGAMLRELSERAQVITITHLPQIASVAERHFSVAKIAGDPTHTRIELLSESERPEEIRRMLGGKEFLSLVSQGTRGSGS